MRKFILLLCTVLVLGVAVPKASADSINLNYWELSSCSAPSCNPGTPPWTFGLQPATLPVAPDPFGLPTSLTFTVPPPGGIGTFNVVTSFFDFDIYSLTIGVDENYAVKGGTAGAGEYWDYGKLNSVWHDYAAETVPGNPTGSAGPYDIAFSINWAFSLAADQQGVITYYFNTAPPQDSSLYLQQYILAATGGQGTSIYFWSTLDISTPGTPPVPEPGTMLLLGTGLVGLARAARRRR